MWQTQRQVSFLAKCTLLEREYELGWQILHFPLSSKESSWGGGSSQTLVHSCALSCLLTLPYMHNHIHNSHTHSSQTLTANSLSLSQINDQQMRVLFHFDIIFSMISVKWWAVSALHRAINNLFKNYAGCLLQMKSMCSHRQDRKVQHLALFTTVCTDCLFKSLHRQFSDRNCAKFSIFQYLLLAVNLNYP